jgi:thioredoxin 1
MSELGYVTEKEFQSEVLEADPPVLVDFTAVWCGPCKAVDPIVTQLAGEWGANAKVVKCDSDKNPNIVMQFGIMGIPTLRL